MSERSVAKLVMNPHSPARRELPLPRTLLSIGRDPSNDLVLPDAMVSRRHAVVECRGSQYFLRDCNSSNGSLVNGDRVSERPLRDGDLVAIGTARLLFREEVEALDAGGKVLQHPSAPRLLCTGCQADYRKGDAFCRQCGARIQEGPPKIVCPSCGTAVPLPARFCNACGQQLAVPEPAPAQQPRTGPLRIPEPALAAAEPPLQPAAASPTPAPQPASQGKDADGSGPHSPGPQRAESGQLMARASSAALPRSIEIPAPVAEPGWPARVVQGLPRPRALVVPLLSRVVPRPAQPALPEPTAAPLGLRFLAGLVDGLLLVAAEAVLVGPVWWWWQAASPTWLQSTLFVGWSVLVASLGLALLALCWGLRGATPAQGWFGLEVVRLDGQPLSLRGGALRAFGLLLSVAALGLGLVPLLFGGEGLHDRLAHTRLVRARRG